MFLKETIVGSIKIKEGDGSMSSLDYSDISTLIFRKDLEVYIYFR